MLATGASCGSGGTSVGKFAGTIAPPPITGSPGEAGPVPPGIWGGTGISLNVTESAATMQMDCAHASIPHALRAGADGYFTGNGTITLEGGPEPAEGRPAYPASFRGAFDGNSMDLVVHYLAPDGQTSVSNFKLTLGAPPNLIACL